MSNPYDPYGSGSSYNPYPTQRETYQQYPPPSQDPYSAYSQQPVYVQPIVQPVYQPVIIAARQTNGKATAAMVLGLCTFITWFLTGIPAIILGHMALSEINNSGGTQDGKGMAITGLVLGYLSIASLLCICLYFILAASASGGFGG